MNPYILPGQEGVFNHVRYKCRATCDLKCLMCDCPASLCHMMKCDPKERADKRSVVWKRLDANTEKNPWKERENVSARAVQVCVGTTVQRYYWVDMKNDKRCLLCDLPSTLCFTMFCGQKNGAMLHGKVYKRMSHPEKQ